jgi:hypothetical protein
MTVQTLAAVISTLIALLSAAVAVLVFLRQRRQSDFELARSLHQDLTSGEVARARDLLGTVHYAGSRTLADAGAAEAVRAAYFTVLWCFERIHAGRLVLARSPAARAFLDELIRWHVAEWWRGLDYVKTALIAHFGELYDADSRKSLDHLAELLGVVGTSAVPVTGQDPLR